ncbi:hypothetical protein CBR_g34523 [Chara braunii]|uniref:Uncharacterized protein n=1 Tax=Chara braunii TaxID=69332 RepID=A0A388LIS6_CHABU|nr:hypothetical protein CBR_g34523 [Chara braunii]|eukprot:GBG82240.1 hypothetical protein CBR_g34523 [Chara braunii]
MKAQAQADAIRMKEKVERLTATGNVFATPISILRTRMEQAAVGSVAKGKQKVTPGRASTTAKEVNDRFQFIKEQKELGKKNTAQLTEICKQMGISYKKMDVTIEEIIDKRVSDAFGSFAKAGGRGACGQDNQGTDEEQSDDVAEVHEVLSGC